MCGWWVKIAPDGGDTVWDEVIKQDRNQRGKGHSAWHRGVCTARRRPGTAERESLQGENMGIKTAGVPASFQRLQADRKQSLFSAAVSGASHLGPRHHQGQSVFLISLICPLRTAVWTL